MLLESKSRRTRGGKAFIALPKKPGSATEEIWYLARLTGCAKSASAKQAGRAGLLCPETRI
jgi:hypothetical protein